MTIAGRLWLKMLIVLSWAVLNHLSTLLSTLLLSTCTKDLENTQIMHRVSLKLLLFSKYQHKFCSSQPIFLEDWLIHWIKLIPYPYIVSQLSTLTFWKILCLEQPSNYLFITIYALRGSLVRKYVRYHVGYYFLLLVLIFARLFLLVHFPESQKHFWLGFFGLSRWMKLNVW